MYLILVHPFGGEYVCSLQAELKMIVTCGMLLHLHSTGRYPPSSASLLIIMMALMMMMMMMMMTVTQHIPTMTKSHHDDDHDDHDDHLTSSAG